MHGQHAYFADEDEARRLFRMGYGRGVGTKKKLHEIHLVVPVRIAAEQLDVVAVRDLTGLARDRYHFRDDELIHSVGWKLRKIPKWQRKLFGPQTARDAYQRPPRKEKSRVLTHGSHKKGRARA
jgi:hypothetical protein